RPVPRPAPEADEKATRYGRQELHVSTDVSSRYKKKKPQRARRGVAPAADGRHAFEMPTQPMKREVSIPETITVAELAQKMAIKGSEVIKTLMNMGVMATINQPLDQDTAVLVIEEFGNTAKIERENQIEEGLQESDSTVALETRAPVVTVMGHVD